jgi:hypothetical protein
MAPRDRRIPSAIVVKPALVLKALPGDPRVIGDAEVSKKGLLGIERPVHLIALTRQ